MNQILILIGSTACMAFLRKPGENIEENDSIISSEEQHDHSLRQKIYQYNYRLLLIKNYRP